MLKTACPLCGKLCDRIEVGGVKLTGCPCVPADRFYAVSVPHSAFSGLDPSLFDQLSKQVDKSIATLAECQVRLLTQPSVHVVELKQDAANFKIGMRMGAPTGYEPFKIGMRMQRGEFVGYTPPPTVGTCECFAANLCDEHKPIAVGDYVRWEVDREIGTRWIEGEVKFVSDDGYAARISIDRSDGYQVGREQAFGLLGCGVVVRRIPRPNPNPDPLDVKYDGVTLRALLEMDERRRREVVWIDIVVTPAQRAAVSAHWSAELRARAAAAKAKERERVVLDIDAEDL